MLASLASPLAEASDSDLLTVLERMRSSSPNPARSPLSRQSEKNDRESLRWNVVGFHTNLYLFALASNLLPSTKASSKDSPFFFAKNEHALLCFQWNTGKRHYTTGNRLTLFIRTPVSLWPQPAIKSSGQISKKWKPA